MRTSPEIIICLSRILKHSTLSLTTNVTLFVVVDIDGSTVLVLDVDEPCTTAAVPIKPAAVAPTMTGLVYEDFGFLTGCVFVNVIVLGGELLVIETEREEEKLRPPLEKPLLNAMEEINVAKEITNANDNDFIVRTFYSN